MRKEQLHFSRELTGRALRAIVGGALALIFSACGNAGDAKFLAYKIVATHPHDIHAFTQGLAILDGELLESTGRNGQSALLLKNIANGKVLRRAPLHARHFGEGLAVVQNRILQLTWTSGVALQYDLQFKRAGEFSYRGQGWGLAFDGKSLLMSDGSDRITLRRPDTFAAIGQVNVHEGKAAVPMLNELEFAGGWLYANVWHTDRIAVIDPASGAVRGWLDLAALRARFSKPPGWDESEHVLNGVAFNPANGHFYVTGKCWPALFELKVEILPPP